MTFPVAVNERPVQALEVTHAQCVPLIDPAASFFLQKVSVGGAGGKLGDG